MGFPKPRRIPMADDCFGRFAGNDGVTAAAFCILFEFIFIAISRSFKMLIYLILNGKVNVSYLFYKKIDFLNFSSFQTLAHFSSLS